MTTEHTEEHVPCPHCAAVEDVVFAMPMADLITVACAYLRRLRADPDWDEAEQRGDEESAKAAYGVMMEADFDARFAFGLIPDDDEDDEAEPSGDATLPLPLNGQPVITA